MQGPAGSLAEQGAGAKSADLPPASLFYRQNLVAGEPSDGDDATGCRRRTPASFKHTFQESNHFGEHQNQRSAGSQLNAASNSLQDDEKESELGNRTTDGQTMMHILKANIGTGVLALPLAFKNVGLWCGLVLVPLIGFICIHCMNILISSHNNLCDRFNYESLDYDQVASLGLACGPRWARRFAKKASIIVTIFLMFTQLGFCCVYILFTVENLQVACMNLFGLNYSMLTYLLAVFPVIGLTSCTSNLKHLARISTLANVLQLLGLALIFFDLLQFHTYASWIGSGGSGGGGNLTQGQLEIQQRPELVIVVDQGISSNIASGLPLFFATAVYAFEGIGVVLPLVKEMQCPARIAGLNGVLNTSMSLVALLYMAMGFFGYAKYGQTVAGSITLNLPESTLNELVRLAFALAIGLSYGLQFYIPWSFFWPLIDESLFYSYRPRVSRDKLSILDKMTAENHWALAKVLEEANQHQQAASSSSAPALSMAASTNRSRECEQAASEADHSTTTTTANNNKTTSNLNFQDNSTATTMATSYSMSVVSTIRPLLPAGQKQAQGQHSATCRAQYGALEQADLLANHTMTSTTTRQDGGAQSGKRLRNRLEDVVEQSADEDSMMPEVQWRPPPRSMRGKRKLVRYTVILLAVSLTFVAAALIPRLDLFISLIGALASSCLAIIFPAIIQLCTFWNDNSATTTTACQDGRHDGDEEAANELCKDEGPCGEQQFAECNCLSHDEQQQQGAKSRLLKNAREECCHCKRHKLARPRGRRRAWTRSLAWKLFLCKNLFLVLFGFLGLITGTWVSLQQLGAMGAQV